jgi:hypothetical protein
MVMVAVAFIVLDAAEASPIAVADIIVVLPLRTPSLAVGAGVFVLLLFPPLPGNEEVGILLSFVLESAIL